MAGSLLLSSVSVVSNRFSSSWRQHDYHYIKRFQRKKYIFNCQRITNSTSNEFPHFIIEGSCSWASKIPTQSLLDQRKLILSPSRRNQEDTLATDLITFKQNARKLVEVDEGIGITKYLKGKKFLITGATGFLAKVLIEKILRTVPDVGKIFLLIKAKSEKAAIERMQNEIIDIELFKYLREAHGENYHVFMLNKLVPVVGNVGEDNLGIQSDLGTQIEEEVDFIVNSAANTAFDERYDVSLDVNTVGPCKLMIFAKRCKKLKLFLHVSTETRYNSRKPFSMGESIATERSESEILQLLDIEAELKLASESRQSSSDNEVTQNMKELGLKRAKKYGWQDTYVFTKAMGEMMIDSMRGDIPVVIIRPSVIESTIQEPFPGWMEGNRMMDPIVLYYGKGQLTGFLVDPKGVLDVVPADMVINATLAAIAKYGRSSKPNMSIYHISSSVTNPLMFQNLARLLFEHFSSSPFTDTKGIKIQVPKMKLFHSMNDFSSHIWKEATQRCQKVTPTDFHGKLSQRLQNICKKSVEQAKYLANIYQPYTFYGGRFDNTNTCKLLAELSDWERENFNFDVRSIDWDDYISNIHIPGLRRHVMKGRGMKVKT